MSIAASFDSREIHQETEACKPHHACCFASSRTPSIWPSGPHYSNQMQSSIRIPSLFEFFQLPKSSSIKSKDAPGKISTVRANPDPTGVSLIQEAERSSELFRSVRNFAAFAASKPRHHQNSGHAFCFRSPDSRHDFFLAIIPSHPSSTECRLRLRCSRAASLHQSNYCTYCMFTPALVRRKARSPAFSSFNR